VPVTHHRPDAGEPGAGGACERITFNPLVLPKGLAPSSDPLLLARPASYAISLGRRLGETPP
jgi:catalase